MCNLCNHIYSSPFLHVFHRYTSYKPCTHLLFSFSQHRWHFKRNFFVPQLTQTTKKLLLLNIACCWRVFWNYTPFFKGAEELRTSHAFTSMANTESSSADWMQLFTNQHLMVTADWGHIFPLCHFWGIHWNLLRNEITVCWELPSQR